MIVEGLAGKMGIDVGLGLGLFIKHDFETLTKVNIDKKKYKSFQFHRFLKIFSYT
jgi:hypothetical protein